MFLQIYYSVLLLSAGVVVIYLIPNKYQKVVSLLCIIGVCALIIYMDYHKIDFTLRLAGKSIALILKQPIKTQFIFYSHFLSTHKSYQCALIVAFLSLLLLYIWNFFGSRKFPNITFLSVEAILIRTWSLVCEYIGSGTCLASHITFSGLLSILVLILLVIFIKYLWDNKDKNGLL
jgi:hypothetical protein